jgi:hypothetical protein
MTAINENHMKRTIGWVAWPVRILLIITIAATIIPMSPGMPGPGLDASWVYGLGEAVALKLAFGKEMVFTLGPYASIYTSSYHPATYHFVLFGSICMALGFSILLVYLLAGRPLLLSLLMILFLACNNGAPDATLMLYPLLLSLLIYRVTLPEGDPERLALNQGAFSYVAIFVLFSVLGLIPLIKGSMLILAVAIGGLCTLRLYLTGHIRLTILAILASVVELLVFWTVTGQSLHDLPSYFIGMLPIASGYTEAMSIKGKPAQIAIYLIPCIVSATTVLLAKSLAWRNRLYLLTAFGLFLFLAFKAGFVRHDAHVTISGGALFLAGVALCMALKGRMRWISLIMCVIGWFAICNTYYPITVSNATTAARNSFERLGNGLWSTIRGSRNLPVDFEKARERLRQEHPIPTMQGTSDIYPFDQSYLIASNNKWSPRPVFQSYSAYTPKLADMNRLHLVGPASPDNILFSLQPIDQRLPALDDGPSWPVLMGLYKPVRYQDGYVYLEKRGGNARTPDLKPMLERDYGVGETVAIPDTQFPMFAQVHMKRTFVGRVLGILFKPEELRITVNLLNGSSRDYRFVPGMGEAGFVLSPLVENTSDILLSYGSWKFLENKRVTSIKISTKSKRSLSWAGYQLTLGELVGQEPTDISSLAAVAAPVKISENGKSLKEADCFGSIDSINGSSPTEHAISYSPILSIQGWIAESQNKSADDSFAATITTGSGSTYVAPLVRNKRPDVAAYFKSDALVNSGYQAFIDVDGLGSDISVGLARKMEGAYVACTHYHRSITLKIKPR